MSFYYEQTPNEDFGPRGDDGCLEGQGECEPENMRPSCNSVEMNDISNDTADAESGVEPDSTEWIYQDTTESVEFDITAEQAMATLQYFTCTAERANILTKTHHDDLDVISSLLQEKEKDLEMAARIGQSLLQRNKQLLLKIDAMEDYMTCVTEKENQMRHEVTSKNDLLKRMLIEEQEFELYSDNSNSDNGYSGDSGCKDESIVLLEKKCKNLEQQNQELLTEAVSLKDLANEAEEQEQDLVVDCMQHLAYAKDQITNLTDEIALKFEDNVAQQEEITQLISTVVELQRKQKQLSTENEDLHYQLEDSQLNQEYLRSQVIDLERRFHECCELLVQNQDEVKTLREQVEYTEHDSWAVEQISSNNMSKHDSLALEIEESVKRELTASDRNKEKTSRVLETVKKVNKFLSPGSHYSPSIPGNMSSAASFKSQSSIDSDDRSVSSFSRSWTGSQDFDDSRRRKGYIPAEKLQIIKPMEGSITLHKWHHLASENVVAALNVGNVLTPQKDTQDVSGGLSQNSLTDYASTVHNTDPITDTRFEDFDDEAVSDDGSDFGITFKTEKDHKPNRAAEEKKQSTPLQAVPENPGNSRQMPPSLPAMVSNVGGLGALGGGHIAPKPDRSIITRNSSLMNTLREGRAMLNKNGGDGKSRADAIDILANAMNKANIEAKTGQRILESMNGSKSRSRAPSSGEKKSYQDMPKLNKVLERLAANNKSGKVDLSAVQPALKVLLEKAAAEQKSTATEAVKIPKAKLEDTSEKVANPDMVLPSLLRGPASMRATPGILGNILQSSSNESSIGNSMLSTMLSTTAGSTTAKVSTARPGLTRSWSSGDLKTFSKENLSRLNSFNTNSSAGQLQQNSSSDTLTSLANTNNDQPLGMGRRTNSSGSLTDLVKQAHLKPFSGSPPDPAAFISFDSYGVGDFSSRSYASSSASAAVTTEASPTTAAAATVAKPTGFLRSLFLGGSSTSSEKPVETKRRSSMQEGPPTGLAIGAGSSASVESGMNRFGKALAQESFSGFGFGFMSYFGGSKKSSEN